MNTAVHSTARDREHERVLDRIVELVTLRARRRIAWLAGPGVDALDEPEAERRWYAEDPEHAAAGRRIVEIRDALAGEDGRPLALLARVFELEGGEVDLLMGCLAPMLDPAIAELYARLRGSTLREHGYASEQLVARLFGWGRRRLWHAASGLAVWRLVSPAEVGIGQPEALIVEPQVLAFLQGSYGLDAQLLPRAELLTAPSPLASWSVDAALERIDRTLGARQSLRVVLVGPRGSGRRSFAAAVAQRLQLAALAVDGDAIGDDEWPDLYLRTQRLSRLAGLVPVWLGAAIGRRWPRVGGQTQAPVPLQFAICEDLRDVRAQAGFVDHTIVLPSPTIDERRELWGRLVPGSAAWDRGAREHLVVRHRLNVGDIAVIGRRLPDSVDEASDMAREQTRGRLGELGRLLDCPFGWDDLVVDARLRDALEDFSFEAQERARFWESPQARRLFPRGTGLVALFTGPPGTGKTMAAQVIAADLELDLFRIDLASVVSKYIGETAKNLDKIFTRASRMNAVLLFDEADSLFSKRTEVKDSHDRHANTDTNYLLQLLEEYQGIALLASNKRNNVDPAFIRRIRYVLEFHRPDAAQRRTIWRQVLRELIGPDALRGLEPLVAHISAGVDLSGAQIKNAVLAAIFIARRRRQPVGVEQLIRGVDRELGKEGRSINDREKGRLRRHA